jgi:hypothetical protein
MHARMREDNENALAYESAISTRFIDTYIGSMYRP